MRYQFKYLNIERLNYRQAHLKMDRRTSKSARIRRVHELIKQMGLYGVRHTKIGLQDDDKLLSGGEKKRLSFATEVCSI